MTSAQQLPAVAQRVYTDCKKCACERYHIVLAHSTATSAKVECEVCHAKKTYKVGPAKAKKAAGPKKTKSTAVANRWEEVKTLINEKEKQSYNMKKNFQKDMTIEHPKFGIGIVTAIVGKQSIEVVFADGVRALVQNRP